jgi:hypothetical protein
MRGLTHPVLTGSYTSFPGRSDIALLVTLCTVLRVVALVSGKEALILQVRATAVSPTARTQHAVVRLSLLVSSLHHEWDNLYASADCNVLCE